MQKTILTAENNPAPKPVSGWLSTESIASIAVTSEQTDSPVENIFDEAPDRRWCAAESGSQVIRVILEKPSSVTRIQLEFSEAEVERTQEFSLSWATSPEAVRHEIVRQRWNFSPHGSTRESEDLTVKLEDILVLELVINPDVSGGPVLASLDNLRIGVIPSLQSRS